LFSGQLCACEPEARPPGRSTVTATCRFRGGEEKFDCSAASCCMNSEYQLMGILARFVKLCRTTDDILEK
jgi:hypothetical protein